VPSNTNKYFEFQRSYVISLNPIIVFIVVIFGFVALAYYPGGRQIMKCNLVEALQSDNMI